MINCDYLIVGAGISGLTMGLLLHKNGFNFKIIEKTPSIQVAEQGYSLTLQKHTKEIYEKYGVLDDMLKFGAEVKEQIFMNGKGEILYRNDNERFNFPVPRQKIREVLFNNIPSDSVVFNKKLIAINNDDKKCIVSCEDNTMFCCKILLACDGIHSKIRSNYFDAQLNRLPFMNMYGLVDLNLLQESDKIFFRNKEIQLLDGTHRLFCKPFNESHSMWEFTYGCESKEYLLKKEQLFEQLLDVAKSWSNESFLNFLDKTDKKDIIIHQIEDYIPLMSDIKKAPNNVLFIGDTIHPMSPFIGMGANEAIMDCYVLIELLKDNTNDTYDTYDTYEINDLYYNNLIERTTCSVTRSRENTEFYHTKDAVDINKLHAFKKW